MELKGYIENISFFDIKKNTKLLLEDFFVTENQESFPLRNLFRKIPREIKTLNKNQIITGNIGIDFTNPIYEGSLFSIKSKDTTFEQFFKNIFSLHKEKNFVYFSLSQAKISKFESISQKGILRRKYKFFNLKFYEFKVRFIFNFKIISKLSYIS